MFTGLIEGIGTIEKIELFENSRRFWISTPFSLEQDQEGDSIAVNGCCLTITQKNGDRFCVDVSPETLSRTTLKTFQANDFVNLERAARLQDRLGGHLVQGHVDGLGKILSKKEIFEEGGSYILIEFGMPRTLRKYLVEKGSITVDGVSLTVNSLQEDHFSVCIIPHTQQKTTLTQKEVKSEVNLEVDVIAKYVESLIHNR